MTKQPHSGHHRTQVQPLGLVLLRSHEISMGPLVKLIQVPLDGIPTFRNVSHTIQLGIICKLPGGALSPFIYAINEDGTYTQ